MAAMPKEGPVESRIIQEARTRVLVQVCRNLYKDGKKGICVCFIFNLISFNFLLVPGKKHPVNHSDPRKEAPLCKARSRLGAALLK